MLENCYAMGNGYSDFGRGSPKNGNGYGIKMGQSTFGTGHHLIKFCAAWKNKASGFYANYTNAGSTWLNNTAYMNGDRSFSMASALYAEDGKTRLAEVVPLTGDNAHVLKNNIAFPNKNSQIGECWEKISSQNIDHYVECPAGENNTWNLNLDLTEDDFVSLDDPSMTVTGEDLSTIPGMLGPRNADGSLPNVDFLKLKKGSRALELGLGAFEYGEPSIVMTRAKPVEFSGTAFVFDMQGRYLGILQAEQLRFGSVAEVLRAKFRNSGAYIVRQGRYLQKVNVK